MLSVPTSTSPFPKVRLCGLDFSSVTQTQLIEHMLDELRANRGGWIVTANLDILLRHTRDDRARAAYNEADLVVADGMPLVWASHVQGEPFPERVTGSGLVGALALACERAGRSILLLGGAPGSAEGAAERFRAKHPRLRIHGDSSPRCSALPTPIELAALEATCVESGSDIVLVGLGSPKQEFVIRHLRRTLPTMWFVGVGVSFSFAKGDLRRAPEWVQTLGLEWLHRLVQEPRRLAKRYIMDDAPFLGRLLLLSVRERLRR